MGYFCLPRLLSRESGLTSYWSGLAGWLPVLVTIDNGLVVAIDGRSEFCFYMGSGHCLLVFHFTCREPTKIRLYTISLYTCIVPELINLSEANKNLRQN